MLRVGSFRGLDSRVGKQFVNNSYMEINESLGHRKIFEKRVGIKIDFGVLVKTQANFL